MSKLSIYETNWINIVFENKNQEYGAYQLRQENPKTAFAALFTGITVCAVIASIIMVVTELKDPIVLPTTDTVIDTQLHTVTLRKIEKEEPIAPPAQKQTITNPIAKSQLINPVVAKVALAVQDIAPNTDNVAPVKTENIGAGIAVTNVIPGGNGSATATSSKPDIGNTVVSSTALDKLPEFPGGINKFYTFVGRNFKQPELESGKTMRVYISFVIEKDGSMSDIKVLNDPGYGLGAEAIRVLKSLKTKWSPGMVDAKPVRTVYNLPITVKSE